MRYYSNFKPCFSTFLVFLFLFFFFSVDILPVITAGAQEQPASQKENQKKKEEEKPVRIRTEEIIVTAPSPEQKPLASVFVIRPEVLELSKPKNIAEVLSFAPGTYVTTGSKAESHVKIRGLDNDKSVLLLDGIPIYEPYFNLYDLKTIPSLDVEYAQVTKGPSSVLYGANTMGGIVEVLTRRPQENSLELSTRLGPTSSFSFSGSGSYVSQRFSLKLAASHEETEGYEIKDSGKSQLFPNTDYRNNYFSGKVYFFPGQRSEILLQASFFDSAYGVPVATAYYSPRYWRFKDWERFMLGLGGTFPLFKSGTLKIRTYYVSYYNVLDAYTDATYSTLNWESIYKNYSAGAFILGTVNPRANHELCFSLNGRLDRVKQQASETSPWESYEHNTYSFGLEDEWKLTPKWHFIAGLSLDYLKKQEGGHRTSLNPIIGLKFRPQSPLELHLSYSQKSRFPSMRSLYSSTSGNPDLKDEIGRNFEFGTAYHGWVNSRLTLFTSSYRDFINVIRQPDGTKLYVNVGKARIRGLEVETSKSIGDFNIQLQYAYLDAKNLTDNRKLDLIPASQLSLLLNYLRAENYALTIWLVAASKAEIVISNETVTVPAYATANLSVEKYFRSGSVFIKVENLLNKTYFTEPGYPISCRRIEIGFGFHTGL
ncbi:MAG: TonB-dependent receptor [Methanosarcina sp.]|nr:TonB-dependent receptor [Methanosarcina sp.]